ncbi:leucine-rich repeat protein [Chryseobacterium mucoviscidosis]|uniref:leucine-rich repeat protein n=1 Tax=Chryseobacterium mucoviscidosis TaxID=1945581 RepID=UPI003017BFB4
MEKPQIILDFEEKYKIEIREVKDKRKIISRFLNYYFLNENYEVIGLSLFGNLFSEIPNLKKFEQLEILNLNHTRISRIQGLDNLQNLQSLHLVDNQISKIENLDLLQSLQNLTLRNNQIFEIEGLDKLTKLQSLDLINNKISKIDGLNSLQSLRDLTLSNNQISKIEGLDTLYNLQDLDLDNNQILKIEGFKPLYNLQSLSLNNNRISKIEGLETLQNLQDLSLSSNQISKIEGFDTLQNLQSLSLSSNQISKIEGFDALKKLQLLVLGRNQIFKIEGLLNLNKLKYLFIYSNKIEILDGVEIPISNGHINLSYNEIKEIINFENVKNIWHLNLYSNKITDILPLFPLFRSHMNVFIKEGNYKYGIGIGANPLDESILSILNVSYKEERREILLDYFINLLAGQQPLREAKLMLLGEGEAGKTNLRNYILGEPFNANKSATTGIVVDRHNMCIDETDYRINIWDFGGQWIQQQVHKFFITNESLYLIVLNGRNEERPEKWLDWIKNYTDDSMAIVVINKMDNNHSYRLEENVLRKNYPFIIDFHYISLLEIAERKEDAIYNGNQLSKTISEQILLLKNINTPVASNFHDLKRDLEDNVLKEKTHINYDAFGDLFVKHQLKGKVDSFLEILNKIGTIRYFEMHDRLILNPEWLSGGVYKVLMSEFTAKSFGVFKESDFDTILQKAEEDKFSYVKRDYPFISQMMKEFEIAYVENGDYFVPSLFKNDLPEEFVKSNMFDQPNIHFIFNFHSDYPEALISKFIVSFFSKRHDGMYWKNGIVLLDKDEELTKEIFAYVESSKDEKRIRIKIIGKDSRNFFKDIKKKINSLLEKTNYQYDELIVHNETNTELNYKDYVELYKGGERTRKESTKNGLVEVNIAEILGLVNNHNDLNKMSKKDNDKTIMNIGTYNDFRDSQVDNSIISSKEFTQNNYVNRYKDSTTIAELKTSLEKIDQAMVNDQIWKNNLLILMDEIYNLENAQTKEEETKAKEGASKFINWLKGAKDAVVVASGLANEVPKLIDSGEKVFLEGQEFLDTFSNM